ncbi:hypothetical protein, partial [Paracoccus hibiscisoli]|uniref:hypothetical protein n=1 Tax=Paracoccus hibiscisoli TaxID=2023261 RepID=UPI0023EFAA20
MIGPKASLDLQGNFDLYSGGSIGLGGEGKLVLGNGYASPGLFLSCIHRALLQNSACRGIHAAGLVG